MAKHLIKIENPLKVALSIQHEGRDQQYADAGDIIKLDWQPASGWGLQEAHYTDDNGNIVSIDLENKEFTMPDSNITISGMAKRFVLQDWTTNDPSNAGKVVSIDKDGNLVPTAGAQPLLYQEKHIIPINPTPITLTPPSPITDWTETTEGGESGYQHTSGNTTALELSTGTGKVVNGKEYVVVLKVTDYGSDNEMLLVSLGTSPKVSTYFDVWNTDLMFGFKAEADNAPVIFTPKSSYTGKVYDIRLYEVVENSDSILKFTAVNVYNFEANDISGRFNIAIGDPNTTFSEAMNATRCVAVGYKAMQKLISGARNIAIGTFALQEAQEGESNISIGADSLYKVFKPTNNVAIGVSAMGTTYSPVNSGTFDNNVCIGGGSGTGTCSGMMSNVIIGNNAGSLSVGTNSKYQNVFIGANSGASGGTSSAQYTNVAIGYNAGYKNLKAENVYIGSATQRASALVEKSIVIGHGAHIGDASGSFTYGIAIGHQTEAKSNQIYIGNTNQYKYHEMVLALSASGKFVFSLGATKYQLVFNNDNTITWTTPS